MNENVREPLLEHRQIDVGEVELHVALAGPASGSPVLLLHGFPEFWQAWRNQLAPLADAGLRVIVPDLRGYNRSDKPDDARHYHPQPLVADMIGLLDALGLERAHVVGHDWGGLLAWWLAEAHPRRLLSLSILNAPHPRVFQRAFLHHPSQLLRSVYLLLFQVPFATEVSLKHDDFRLLTRMLTASSRTGTFSGQDLQRYREAWSRDGALEGMLAWYRALPQYAGREQPQRSIDTPTQIIWGDRDPAFASSMAADSLELCRDARLHRLPGASHWLHHEQPQEVSRLLLEFIGETEAAAASVGFAIRGVTR